MLKILVIQPQDVWHWNFDSSLIEAISNFGDIIFVGKADYLIDENIKHRINLQKEFFEKGTKFNNRINNLRIVSNCKKIQNRIKPDVTVFLSYDTMSMLLWRSKAIICEHNNIFNTNTNFLKRYLYRLLSKKLVSISLQNHINSFIVDSCKRVSFVVHHPVKKIRGIVKNSVLKHVDKTTLFFTSVDTEGLDIISVKDFLMKNQQFFAYIKGNSDEKTRAYKIKIFFKNYYEIMDSCDFIVILGGYDYRVSGVVYEALSLGKSVVLNQSLFSEELKSQYPDMVRIIRNINEINFIKVDKKKIQSNLRLFNKNTSNVSIVNSLKPIIDHVKS